MASSRMRLVKWNAEAYLNAVDTTMLQRMTLAAGLVERDVKVSMKGGGTPHVPSQPGEPPHVDTGAYRAAIFSVALKARRRVRGFVVSPSRQARALEYGYAPNNLAPRPHLRPALARNLPRIRQILGAPIRTVAR